MDLLVGKPVLIPVGWGRGIWFFTIFGKKPWFIWGVGLGIGF